MSKITCAIQINVAYGRSIWVGPKGRPFWTHNSNLVLTDDEITQYLGENFTYEARPDLLGRGWIDE